MKHNLILYTNPFCTLLVYIFQKRHQTLYPRPCRVNQNLTLPGIWIPDYKLGNSKWGLRWVPTLFCGAHNLDPPLLQTDAQIVARQIDMPPIIIGRGSNIFWWSGGKKWSTKRHLRHCVVSLSKTLYSLFSTGSTQKNRYTSRYNWKLVDWDVKHLHKQTEGTNTILHQFYCFYFFFIQQ